MEGRIDFDVIMPAFNAEAFLPDALNGIVNQTVPPKRVIVIDDGSTDSTPAIANRYSPLVTCISQLNSGQGLARRRAIAYCDSPWIALCDSDDIWNKDHLARRCKLIETFPDAQFTFSDCYSFGPTSTKGHRLSSEAPAGWDQTWKRQATSDFFQIDDPYRAFLKFNPAFPSGIAFRRDAYERMGGFLPKYSRWIGEDAEFIRRFLLVPDIVVAGDSQTTWGYRRHDNNYSKNQWENILSKATILQEHMDLGLVPERYHADITVEIKRARLRALDHAFQSGNFEAVGALYRQLPCKIESPRSLLKFLFAKSSLFSRRLFHIG